MIVALFIAAILVAIALIWGKEQAQGCFWSLVGAALVVVVAVWCWLPKTTPAPAPTGPSITDQYPVGVNEIPGQGPNPLRDYYNSRSVGAQPGTLGLELASLDSHPEYRSLAPAGTGVLISRVHNGSAAQAAGIMPGDVALAVDGRPIVHLEQIAYYRNQHAAGDRVTLRVARGGAVLDIGIVVPGAAGALTGVPATVPNATPPPASGGLPSYTQPGVYGPPAVYAQPSALSQTSAQPTDSSPQGVPGAAVRQPNDQMTIEEMQRIIRSIPKPGEAYSSPH